MSSTAPAEVRTHLIDALQLDLVGPTPDDLVHAEEIRRCWMKVCIRQGRGHPKTSGSAVASESSTSAFPPI
jgi:hypothetical protein